MNDKLFDEFPPVTTEQWEKKILEDLKGADYNKKLIWKSIEEINIKPYYRSENTDSSLVHSFTGSIVTSKLMNNLTNELNNNWQIRQDLEEDNIELANKFAVEAIKKGADAIGFNAKKVDSHKHLSALLKDIDLNKTAIHFVSSKSYPTLFDFLETELAKRKQDLSKVQFSFNFDSISYLLLHGNFYTTRENNFYEAEYLVKKIQDTRRKIQDIDINIRPITVNGHYFHNAGASAVQELAFSLASANEYLTQLTDKKIPVDDVAKSIVFSFATGSSYFIEIAKLRAARMLWARILTTYDLGLTTPMFIHSYTSSFNKSIYDPYNNMLRSTTEAMSAAIGGADSITVNPFDNIYKHPDEFSYRIARNTQFILKAESYLEKVIDPSAGSYYLENLTDSLAKAAWNLFKEVESQGGCIESIKNNFIQNRIEETSEKRKELVSSGKQTILGVNQYANQNEQFTGSLVHPFTGTNEQMNKLTNEQIVKTLNIHRASQDFEKIRLDTENYIKKGNARPKVFLLTIGNLAMRRARATFSANFFGCSGYEILDNNGFCSVDEGVEEALKADSQIVVICSSDEEYETFAPEITKRLKDINNKIIVIVAGNPKDIIQKLKDAGVDDFISMTSNLQTTLMNYQDKLKIKS